MNHIYIFKKNNSFLKNIKPLKDMSSTPYVYKMNNLAIVYKPEVLRKYNKASDLMKMWEKSKIACVNMTKNLFFMEVDTKDDLEKVKFFIKHKYLDIVQNTSVK